MIKIEELRIGNWVFDQDCEPYYFQIEQIRKDIGDSLWVYYRNGSIKCKVPEPIPLTEEILLKCGFVPCSIMDNHYYLEGLLLWNIQGMFINGRTDVRLKHLHQLQNLYFALTNEELNYDFNK